MRAERPGGARSCQALRGGLGWQFQAEWALPPSGPRPPGEGSPERGKSGWSLSWTKPSGALQPCCIQLSSSCVDVPGGRKISFTL